MDAVFLQNPEIFFDDWNDSEVDKAYEDLHRQMIEGYNAMPKDPAQAEALDD